MSEALLELRDNLWGPSPCSQRVYQGEVSCSLSRGTWFATGKVGRIKRHSWSGRLRQAES